MQKTISSVIRALWIFSFLVQIIFSIAQADQENYTHRLTQSNGSFDLWTTPPSERVFKDHVLPTAENDEIKVYGAKNEFEPFQLIVKPNNNVTTSINISDFGEGIESEIYQVKYVNIAQASDILGQTGDYPDPLWPIEKGANISLAGDENTSFWFSLKIPKTTPAGDYTATVTIGALEITVKLHVFDFTIADEPHIKSQMNFSYQTILQKYGVSGTGDSYWMYVDKIKQYFIDHRLTPKSALWSGGLTSGGGGPYIDYNCDTDTFTDNDGIWGFEDTAERYLGGTGLMQGKFTENFNEGVGFNSFMVATFQNNDASQDQRPGTFCGETRDSTDWYLANDPASAYNQKWFGYIAAMRDYLNGKNYLDKAYYYFANEPQNQDDYDAVAWYSRHLKEAAPDLKLMVSENPRTEIYNHPDYVNDGQIDIWLPVLHHYDPVISWDRERNHGEVSWIYFLHGTRPPYFNPITLDHPGIESKLTGWLLWKYRIRGIAYYSLNNWSKNPWTDPRVNNHNGDTFMLYPPNETNNAIPYGSNNHRFVPSIRFELMRDSLEDYEYLYYLNNNSQPIVEQANESDNQADKIISGLASYTRDSNFLYNMRRLIGLKISGEISEIPDIQPPIKHPRAEGSPGDYYINFQDPDGEPATTYEEDTYGNGHMYKYVNYAGQDYLQAGTEQYDQAAGYGWLDDTTNFLAGRDPWGSEQDERKITYVYDNWAHHPSIFEFDLPNGTYDIEVSVGTPRRVRPHNRVVIEGITFIDDEASDKYIIRSQEVTVMDSRLTIDVGIFDEYTMLNYLDIEAIIKPTVSIYSPVDDAIDVVLNANPTLIFDKTITKGSGNIILKKMSDDSVFETINVDSGQVALSSTTETNDTVTIDPTNDFAPLTEYYIEIADTAFEDIEGNNYEGISNKTIWNFTTIDVASTLLMSWLSDFGLDMNDIDLDVEPDGLITLLEYTFNFDPTLNQQITYYDPNTIVGPEGPIGLPRIELTGSEPRRLQIIFPKRKNAFLESGVTYTGSFSNDLNEWVEVDQVQHIVTSINDSWDEIKIIDPVSLEDAPEGKRFGRVSVSIKP